MDWRYGLVGVYLRIFVFVFIFGSVGSGDNGLEIGEGGSCCCPARYISICDSEVSE